jgi:hypothetical protein
MGDFVLVEFMISFSEFEVLMLRLDTLDKSCFTLLADITEYEIMEDHPKGSWASVYGRITTEYACLIKVQDPFLSKNMRISYIPSDLKDRHRQWGNIDK